MANIYKTTNGKIESLAEFANKKIPMKSLPPDNQRLLRKRGKASKSIKKQKTFKALLHQGMPVGMAAAISNAQADGTIDYHGRKKASGKKKQMMMKMKKGMM